LPILKYRGIGSTALGIYAVFWLYMIKHLFYRISITKNRLFTRQYGLQCHVA